MNREAATQAPGPALLTARGSAGNGPSRPAEGVRATGGAR
jgi:hypothetical protein